MEVPFISSGATSRAHYTLVRTIESSTSIQSVNHHLSKEIKSIHHQLAQPALSLDRCRECLIILLYCHITVTHGFLPHDSFDFALSHAINLAEAGQNIKQKRIGYLFCAEIMPQNHELQLMLVNTIRKDLEHESIARICLALDNIIMSWNEDLVPAIQPRLHDLLSHKSSNVRRRALLAFRSLSRRHPELLTRIGQKVVRGLRDTDASVASAALMTIVHIVEPPVSVESMVNDILKVALENPLKFKPWFLLKVIQTLNIVGLTIENIPIVLELIHTSSSSNSRAMLQGAFLLLSKLPLPNLLSLVTPEHRSPIHDIRKFLISEAPNDVYLFVSCLRCVDPMIWAGTSPEVSAILENWEVERIMRLLDSSDVLIRRTTLKLLSRVDLDIISSYHSKAIEAIPPNLSNKAMGECAIRLLEVVEIQSGEDGEMYARESKDLLVRLERLLQTNHLVLEAAVEMILLHVRYADSSFQLGCHTALLTFVGELELQLPQTIMVITAALATEFCGRLSVSPVDLIKGFAFRLSSCTTSVQDVCLLAMLRIAADCSEVPSEVMNIVTELAQQSGRHILQRCEQFTTLVNQRPVLDKLIIKARSSSLPDFLAALQDQDVQRTTSPMPQGSSSQHRLVASKLRYKAYDTPLPAPKLRARRGSNSLYSSASSRSETLSEGGHESSSRASSRLSVLTDDPLSRTVTAGELALAAGRGELETMAKRVKPETRVPSTEHMDLIGLDSPFVSDLEVDFETLWNSIEAGEARGQYNGTIDNAVERMHKSGFLGLKVIPDGSPPFVGELKIIIPTDTALRLGGSNWWLRSKDSGLRERLEGLLRT